jgi:hypothetical protein
MGCRAFVKVWNFEAAYGLKCMSYNRYCDTFDLYNNIIVTFLESCASESSVSNPITLSFQASLSIGIVSVMTFTDEAHLKEIGESARSQPLRVPPAIKEKEDLERNVPSLAGDRDVEYGNGPIFSESDSADDAGNPQNWTIWKKVFHTAIPALYGFVV